MTGRIWVVVGAVTAAVVVCACVSCIGLVAVYPTRPSYNATKTAMAWATESSLPTKTPLPTNAPRPTDTPAAMPTPPYITYIVQSGDSLSGIAAGFGTTAEAIMELNGLTSTVIYSGTQLLIPTGEDFASPPEREAEGPAATAAPAPHVIRSLSDFESSQFCLVYGCKRDATWDLRRGGMNNSYDVDVSPVVGVEVVTLDGVPVDFGLTFYERSRLTADDLQLVHSFLTSIYPGYEVDSSMMDFIEQDAESHVFQICEARSVAFGSMRIWAGKIIQQTVHIAGDCP